MSDFSSERILLVDDDRALLDGFTRRLRKIYAVRTACGGLEGLMVLRKEAPISVVVSDCQMPGMNGIAFLKRVEQDSPRTVRIMFTGNADQQSAVSAVNEGHVFRYLTKPCELEVLCETINAAIEHYRLQKAEDELLENTLRGCIEALAEVLALSNPQAFGRSRSVQGYARRLTQELGMADGWRIETAALLSLIGLVAVPAEILRRHSTGQELAPKEQSIVDGHPLIGRDLLCKIPRLESIAEMVANQGISSEQAKSSGLEEGITLGAQILGAALELDELVSGGQSWQATLASMGRKAGFYDARLLAAVQGLKEADKVSVPASLYVNELRIGLLLDQDVRTIDGTMLVTIGNPISPGLLARLRNYVALGRVAEPIRVLILKDSPIVSEAS